MTDLLQVTSYPNHHFQVSLVGHQEYQVHMLNLVSLVAAHQELRASMGLEHLLKIQITVCKSNNIYILEHCMIVIQWELYLLTVGRTTIPWCACIIVIAT